MSRFPQWLWCLLCGHHPTCPHFREESLSEDDWSALRSCMNSDKPDVRNSAWLFAIRRILDGR